MNRYRIAIVTPFIHGGGSGAVTASLLDVLSDNHELEIVTFQGANIEELNRYYGTDIDKEKLKIRLVPAKLGFNRVIRGPLGVQLLSSYIKKNRYDFDIIISVGREMDFGVRGIQYVFYPTLSRSPMILKKMASYSMLKSIIASELRMVYPVFSGYSYKRMSMNLTITISDWTQDIIRRAYGINAHVVYPPVLFTTDPKPWANREDRFICLGRIEPDKNIEKVIGILGKVRAQGYNVKLSIIGALAPEMTAYAEGLSRAHSDAENWILIEKNLSRENLENRLVSARYAIHGRENEHFGISIVEFIKAGCIPFVPNSGGQVEILNNNPNLIYRSTNEAVHKIIRVLKNNQLRSNIETDLAVQADRFSLEHFKQGILAALDRFCLEQHLS